MVSYKQKVVNITTKYLLGVFVCMKPSKAHKSKKKMASFIRFGWALKNMIDTMFDALLFIKEQPTATVSLDPVTRKWYINSPTPLDTETVEHIENRVNFTAQNLLQSLKIALIAIAVYAPLGVAAILSKALFDGSIINTTLIVSLRFFCVVDIVTTGWWFVRMWKHKR